jgi:hypothetical protein
MILRTADWNGAERPMGSQSGVEMLELGLYVIRGDNV